jgi:hypothetical protein
MLSHTQRLQFTLRADCDIFIKLSPRTDSANSLLKTDFLDIPVPLIKPSVVQASLLPGRGIYHPYRSNELGEGKFVETRRSRDIPLLLVPCDVIAACCVGTVFQYCCVTSSRLRGNLVYRLVLRNGLRNLCCVTQQWVDMSQYSSVVSITTVLFLCLLLL